METCLKTSYDIENEGVLQKMHSIFTYKILFINFFSKKKIRLPKVSCSFGMQSFIDIF